MFERILSGVDGREGGRDALALAARLARGRASDLVAVHVAHAERDGSPLDAGPYEELLQRELALAGIRAGTLVIGHRWPGHGLRLAAVRADADLLVLGSSHRGPVGRVLAGDTARAAMHGSVCPVVVAPRGGAAAERTPWTIGVGFDGSREARGALAVAVELAGAGNGRVRLMAVGEPSDHLLDTTPSAEPWPSMDERRLRRSEAMIADALASVRAAGVEADGAVVPGIAVDGLQRLSSAVDLLVVGSRGYGPARRLLIGDTTDRLLHASHCPLLVVPRGHERAGRGDSAVEAA